MERLAGFLGITVKGIEWQINQPKLLGLLNRMGSTKKGYWFVEGDFADLSSEEADKEVFKTTDRDLNSTRVETREENEITRVKILELMEADPSISITLIAKKLGLTVKGVEWQVRQMKKSENIERVGPAKGGKWKVIQKEL